MRKPKRLCLLILILPFYLSMHLNAIKYPIISYQTSDGLPQNQVNALTQDQQGYIFIGTQSGLGKFDGDHFTVFTRKDGLSNNFITGLACDNKNNIWAGTQEGLSKIDSNNHISTYLTDSHIQALSYHAAGNTLWIATTKGVYYKDGKQNTFEKLELSIDFKKPEEIIKGITVTEAGAVYLYSNKRIIERFEEKNSEFILPQAINLIKWLPTLKKLLIGTDDSLNFLDKPRSRLTPFIKLPAGMNNVTDVAADEHGRIWLGTNTGLLYYSNPLQTPIIINNKNGLPAHNITQLLIDNENTVFIGTQWGLGQLSPQLIKMYDESDGLPHKFVWAFHETNDSILIATDQGLIRLDPKKGELTPYTNLNHKLKNSSLRTITPLDQNRYLLGTRRNGIYLWTQNSDHLEQIHPEANVYAAAKTADNTVWFGTTNGLLKYDGTQFQPITDKLKDKNIYAVTVYNGNTILLGTGKGVQKIENGTFVNSVYSNTLDNTVINDIRVVSVDEVLIATELYGLYIFKNKKVTQLTTQNGLLHNDVWSVLKDDSGNIWLNTSVSLDRYKDGFISHFNRRTGLFGDEGDMHAAFKARNGTIYFSIVPGFVEISTQKSEGALKKPILRITEIKINGKQFHQTAGAPQPELKYHLNNLEFQYKAVSSRKENPVLYKTRLHPLEQRWPDATSETRIKYLNLAPDDYTFEVIANNGGGDQQWFNAVNKIAFTINSPLWLRWWFILVLVMLAGLLMVAIVKLRIKAVEKQKQYLETLVEARTKELEYLSITDPLTDLKNRRYLEEKIQKDISLIERAIYDDKRLKLNGSQIPMLGVFILDIDFFKKVNDDYGHKAGDIVIIDIARLLLHMLRNSDTIVRWGGEEFLIITWQKEKSRSFELAERIRKRIEANNFKIDDQITLKKTVSIGFAHFPFIDKNIETVNWSHVVSLADSALYIAKNNGRNMCVGIEGGERQFNPDMDVKKIVSNIKEGIQQKYLKLTAAQEDLEILQHNK